MIACTCCMALLRPSSPAGHDGCISNAYPVPAAELPDAESRVGLEHVLAAPGGTAFSHLGAIARTGRGHRHPRRENVLRAADPADRREALDLALVALKVIVIDDHTVMMGCLSQPTGIRSATSV